MAVNQAIVDILSKYNATGLYPSEQVDRDQAIATWKATVDRAERTFREAGADAPRGAVIKAMQDDPCMMALIARLGSDPGSGLGSDDPPLVFQAIRKHYQRVFSLRHAISGLQDIIARLKDRTNPKTAAMVEQLKKSKGVTLEGIIQRKEEALATNEAELADFMTDPRLQAEVSLLDKYEKMWDDCNQEIGEDNQSKGASLEQRAVCIAKMVTERLGYPPDTEVDVQLNVDWNDRLGEVDLVLTYPGDVMVIVECKSRTHDVMAGWLQNGPKRAAQKTHLRLKGVWTEIPRDTEMFVVTILPKHEFRIPFESLVKRVLTYHVKHTCTPKESWEYGEGLFRDRPVPLQWYLTEGHEHVLLLDS